MKTAKFSVVTAQRPNKLSKGFALGVNGNLLTSPGGNLVQGTVETRAVASLLEFAEILQTLTPAQALAYGVPTSASARILTRKAFAAMGRPADATTRTNDAFQWPDGPGVMMLDYDPRAGADPLDRDELVRLIRTAAPGLANGAMVWWPSASSCIWADDKQLRGIKGQRLYFLVHDATDIPRAGAALVARLWLAGLGHIQISKSGALLERTIVDASVWQSSRLDFAGGAVCGPGLEQRRGAPVIINGNVEIIDTRSVLPDLTPAERDQLAKIKAEARGAAQPEAENIRAAWIAARAAEMVAAEKQGDPEAIKAAEAIARRALERSELSGDFVIHVQTGNGIEPVTVGRLLDNRERYHGLLTRDPLEPDYDGGRLVGRLFLMQARPCLYSFAHGGATYRLHRAPARIELVKGHMAEAAAATIDLLRRDPVVYDFGGEIAIADGGRVHPLCEHGLAHHLGTTTQFWKWVQHGDALVQVDADPPPALLKQILAQGERRKLKPLDGVITGPTIRPDGSLLTAPGYDPATRLLFDPIEEEVPEIPISPTLDQARAALDTLMHPFASFPFVDANAKGALLAAVLTAVVRPVLPTAPAIAFDAPIQGSGKTLLARCVGAVVEGRAPDVWPHTQGRDDEEIRKRLFTALRAGCKALIWDNVSGVFDTASMAAFITADALVDRVLGKSEAVRIPNRAMLVFTGNNLSFAGDLPRRVIICRIDPESDQPFTWQFDLDPLHWVLEHRMSMMAAACTLIRARFVHLRNAAPGRLASFEAWDDLVRQTVVWANYALCRHEFGDPMDLVREAQAADPEADALFALLDALHDEFGTAEFSAKDVMARMQGSLTRGTVETALLDIAGDRAVRSAKSLGRVLKHREGRIVHNMRLAGRSDTARGARMYRVQFVDGLKPGFGGFTGFVSSHTEIPPPYI
jgi:hypothetical protein